MMHEYDNEELTINLTQVFSVHNWTLKPNQPKEPPFTTHIKAIYNLDVPVESKAPKPSSQIEETEASKFKTSQSEKDTQSSSARDKSLSHPLPLTLVVGEMHKEAQQAAGGQTSLGPPVKKEPTLNLVVDMMLQQIPQLKLILEYLLLRILYLKNRVRMKEPKTTYLITYLQGIHISLKVKLEDVSNILKDTRSAFFTPDSPTDKPIIVSDESKEEDEVLKDKDTEATSHNEPEDSSVLPPPSLKSAQIQKLMAEVHLLQSQKEELEQAKAKAKAKVSSIKAKPSYLDINQVTEILVTSLKPELSKLLASHNFASCLPTELKKLPSKITGLFGEIKKLKKHVRDMEIELLRDLKEILTKLETFTSTISSLSS
ncbi:hypothetical protein Tco_1435813 [Tanacetum coccineum]